MRLKEIGALKQSNFKINEMVKSNFSIIYGLNKKHYKVVEDQSMGNDCLKFL